MVSHEVPKLFEAGRNIKFNERAYRWANVVGILFMLPFCVVAGYYRGSLTYKSSGDCSVSDHLIQVVSILLWTINGLEAGTTVLMADALRRIKKSVRENPYLEANGKVMCFHITMCCLHIASYSTTVFFAIRAFKKPGNPDYEMEAMISRISLYSCTSVVQVMMIYLIF